MRLIDIATKVAWHYLGTPYRWGGDDFSSFDCSGFVIEILKSVGKLPREGDWTARGLWNLFPTAQYATEGNLVFWSAQHTGDIIHVEYCLNSELSIGASGGGSKTMTIEDAIRQNAYIKVRPWASRPNMAGFRDPFRKGNEP